MRSRWTDAEAERYCEHYASLGRDLALRVYSARLLGSDPELVLRGCGNASLKGRAVDALGRHVEVLYARARGRELARITPEGLPALGLEPLRALRALTAVPEVAARAELLRARLDPDAPAAAEGTLLHALLPAAIVDESQPTSILALASLPDAASRIREILGENVGWVPYARGEWEQARAAIEVWEKLPAPEALVVEKRGLLTLAEDPFASYERHIELADLAQQAIVRTRGDGRILGARPVVAMRDADEVAPLLRGALAVPTGELDRPHRRWILEHRNSDDIAHFASAPLGPALAAAPPPTPAHVTAARGAYLFLPNPPYADLESLARQLRAEVEAFRRAHLTHFDRCAGGRPGELTALDPTPRIALLPGLGLFAAGQTRAQARLAADIAEHAIRIKIGAATLGGYAGLRERELFDAEYGGRELEPPEAEPPVLRGQVAVVAATGAAGDGGEAIARALLDAGACVLLAHPDPAVLDAALARLASERIEPFDGELRDARDARDAFRGAAERFGGADVLVLGLGADDAERARALAGEAFAQLRAQGTGGALALLAERAAGLGSLTRELAVEGARVQVRVNLVETGPGGAGSLLRMPVTPQHAARAVVFFAQQSTPTTGAVLPIDAGRVD
jgi:rhamnose utilization protein RhaD (predicted bifunctional aldolase and dehydrogenase)/NAD(P)-dependent dehydrogenase (short-subunit alcohol dehydrogenase family)